MRTIHKSTHQKKKKKKNKKNTKRKKKHVRVCSWHRNVSSPSLGGSKKSESSSVFFSSSSLPKKHPACVHYTKERTCTSCAAAGYRKDKKKKRAKGLKEEELFSIKSCGERRRWIDSIGWLPIDLCDFPFSLVMMMSLVTTLAAAIRERKEPQKFR